MSAIAGIIRLDRSPFDRAALDRMQAMLAPYGPDAQHQWRHEGAGLLRTLLRTSPEDNLDRQPLVGADASCVLVFDGRLDNRRELAEKLGLSVADSAGLADSELVWQACMRWDTQAVEYLCGAYALACWQPSRQRLWMARDPMGQRPLFWHRQARFFAFASLPKALFCVPSIPRELCEERMLDHLALLSLKGPESTFKNVFRVEPGHLLILEAGEVTGRRFHRFDSHYELSLARDSDYLEAFQEHLQRAVASCLRSSGPIASHLSSGFDSSTITALAARQLDQAQQRLTAFTAVPRKGFDGLVPRGRHGDESAGARALARRFANIDHELVYSSHGSYLDGIRSDLEAMDVVSKAPCNMAWVNAIYARAQALGCKVLLTGQQGNMSISYTGETYLAALIRRGDIFAWWRELNAYQALHRRSKLRLIGKSLAPSLPRPLWALLARYLERSRPVTHYCAINPKWMGGRALAKRIQASGWDINYQPWHNGRQMRIATLERTDPGEYFMAANLHGIEMRDPTSDVRLQAFCLSVPDQQYLRNGQTRWLLHRMMKGILPAEILSNTSKGYQSADWYEGMERELPRLREELAHLSKHPRVVEMLDLESMQKLLDEWPENGWETHSVISSYRLKLMRGLSAGSFIRYVEDNNH